MSVCMALAMNAQVREGINPPVMDNVPSKGQLPVKWHMPANANASTLR